MDKRTSRAAHVPQHHPSITKERLGGATCFNAFFDADSKLTRIRVSARAPVIKIEAWTVPVGKHRVHFAEAVAAAVGSWEPINVGHSFGPSWSTHWVRISFAVPAEWVQPTLLFDPNCEALLYSAEGEPIQGITGGDSNEFRRNRRVEVALSKDMASGTTVLYAEVVCNSLFGVGRDGLINPPDPDRHFSLATCELIDIDCEGHGLFWDFVVLSDFASNPDVPSFLSARALSTCNAILNIVDAHNRTTFARARAMAREILVHVSSACTRMDSPALPQSTVWAVGHCHIDTVRYAGGTIVYATRKRLTCHVQAWLWPFESTRGKVARSWASQLHYMFSSEPSTMFTASQAVQYAWLAEDQPLLWARLEAAVASGRFIPVGAAWVEPDANMPNGESLVRQLLEGASFFKSRLGHAIAAAEHVHAAASGRLPAARVPHGDGVFFLPDTFGYAPQLPQLILGAGMRYFFTQKLSWSLLNKPEHNTFWWAGLDGSRVLAHFSPADSYNANADLSEIVRSATANKDKGRVGQSLLLYGVGDGGGGPTPPMFEQLRRLGARALGAPASLAEAHSTDAKVPPIEYATLPGMPQVVHGTARQFFDALAADVAKCDVVTWRGELFLELHNGTLTTQAACKRGNRACEVALHAAEFTATAAAILTRQRASSGVPTFVYPYALLQGAWRDLLLVQFHDVLPGSSIAVVYADAARLHESILRVTAEVSSAATAALAQALKSPSPPQEGLERAEGRHEPLRLWNPTPFARTDLVPLPPYERSDVDATSKSNTIVALVPVSIPAYGSVLVPWNASATAAHSQLCDASILAADASPIARPRSDLPRALVSSIPVIRSPAELPVVPGSPDTVRIYDYEPAIPYVPWAAADAALPTPPECDPSPASCRVDADAQPAYIIDTGPLRVRVSKLTGQIVSLLDLRNASGSRCLLEHAREVIAAQPDDRIGGHGGAGPAQGGNRLLCGQDVPFFWDAWDTMPYALEALRTAGRAQDSPWAISVAPLETGPLRVRLRVTMPTLTGSGGSWLEQDVIFEAGSARIDFGTTVHWAEAHRILKVCGLASRYPTASANMNPRAHGLFVALQVEFPLTLDPPAATFETQFGCISRPTHTNTGRDVMQHEVCGHRWADLFCADYGVALLNDCKYAYGARGGRLSLTLLRAPKAPDPEADMGHHTFRYALLPHLGAVSSPEGGFAVISAATQLNASLLGLPAVGSLADAEVELPRVEKGPTCRASDLRVEPPSIPTPHASPQAAEVPGPYPQFALFRVLPAADSDSLSAGTLKMLAGPGGGPVSATSIILDTVKLAQDGSGDLVLRLYEALGCAPMARARLLVAFPLVRVERVNLLEEPQDAQGLPVPTRSGSELKGPIPGAPERGLLNFAPQAVQVAFSRQPTPPEPHAVLCPSIEEGWSRVDLTMPPFCVLTLRLSCC